MPRVAKAARNESGSVAIETLFWLLGVQLPMLALVFVVASAQADLSRTESLIRESARATLMVLERDPVVSSDFESRAQSTFRSILAAAAKSLNSNHEMPNALVSCVPARQCSYLSFSLPARPEKWQPRLQILFAAPTASVQ